VRALAAGGRGVARLADGRTAFLGQAFPGDRVHLQRGRAHSSYVEVERFELLEPSAERRAPPCPDQGRCGGCDWMALSPATQRQHKADILRQSLVRVGKIAPERLPVELPIVAGEDLGYRRRVRLHLAGRTLGFHAQLSRTLVRVEQCHVCAPELWAAVVQLQARLADETVVQAAWLSDVVDVDVRLLGDSPRPALRFGLRPGRMLPQPFLELLAEFAFVEDTDGLGQLHALTETTFTRLPPGGFVQVNSEVNQRLLAEVLAVAEGCEAKTALDVYSGVGNFALPLSRLGIETLGLELAAEAVRCARLAASEQGLPATFRVGDADRLLGELAAGGQGYDLVVLDPPRKGAKGLAGLLAKLCRRSLVMISCDPVTLARDVADLENAGLRLTRTMVLDMFPQTHHIESLSEFRPNTRG
jgi:23S rRNA (uracil1939-C5)-methyltransferase